MTDHDGLIEIRVVKAVDTISAIKAIRETTPHSLSEIRNAISSQTALTIARFYGTDHDDAERSTTALLNKLDLAHVDYEIIIDGDVETREYFDNTLAHWREIVVHTEHVSDLESGEPCIETLEWLKTDAPVDVFRQTLQQIANKDGYNVDDATLEWVNRHLSDA
jgi:hypothetical protein